MPPINDQASLGLARLIDQMCDRFEAQWLNGEQPRLEDYLASVPESQRGQLFLALLPVELELFSRDGRKPSQAYYRGRFPGFEAIVGKVFGNRAASKDTSISRESVRSPKVAAGPPKTEPVPKTIGRFAVHRVLGAGAFGTVYQARDPRLDRDVAIKVPKLDSLGESFDMDRFLREAKTAASLRHPNICPVYEADVEGGRPYIVMAFVVGQPLDNFLKASKTLMPAKQAALVTRRLAQALQADHDKGIVHRDLKPANVMFDRERKDVVVMDFGLARGPRLKDARATQSGVIMGTPAYMSPEQARGEAKTVGPAADVYSLGVMLYEMLAGRRPFNGTVTEVLGQILHVEPEPPSKVRASVDARLEAICLKAMAKDAAARYGSMKEFAAALDVWLRTPSGQASETAKAADTKGDAEASVGASTRQVAEVFAAMLEQQKEDTAAAVGDAVRKARTPRWVFVLLALLFVGGISALAGIIFFARTPTATVMIVIEGLELKDATLAFFLDGKDITREELQKPVELKVGDHELVVMRGQLEYCRYRFVVLGGRDPGIQVTETRHGPGDRKKVEIDPDRAAAEWVLSVGGNVRVAPPDRVPATLDEYMALPHLFNADKLPKTPFRLVGFGGLGKNGTDAAMARFANLSSLRLAWLDDTPLTDAGLAVLGVHKGLLSLNLHVATGITDAGMATVGGLPNLELLWLQNVPITDAGLAHLRGLKKLRDLFLRRNKVTGTGLAHLAGLTALEDLHLNGLPVGDDDLVHLKTLTRLKHLGLGGTKVTGPGLTHLSGLGDLWSLQLGDGAYEGKGEVTNDGLKALTGLKHIRRLHLIDDNSRRLSDEALKPVGRLANLEELALNVPGVTDAGLATLSPLNKMTNLHLVGCSGITDAGLKSFAGMEQLWRLNLGGCAVTGSGFKDLAKLFRLSDLTLNNTPFGDDHVVHLTSFRQLNGLHLERTRVTDKGLAALHGMTTLRGIHLDGSPVTDAGLLALKKALPDCHITPERKPAPAVVPPSDAVAFQGKRYKFYPEVFSWKEAKAKCEAMGGRLAVVTSAEQNAFLTKLVADASKKETWLGATDEVKEGAWLWVDGSSLKYDNWDKSQAQPNNKGGTEHYLVLRANAAGVWSDQPNISTQHQPGFICQWNGP